MTTKSVNEWGLAQAPAAAPAAPTTSVLVGAGVGGIAGFVAGDLLKSPLMGKEAGVIGGVVGAVVGGVAGYFVGKPATTAAGVSSPASLPAGTYTALPTTLQGGTAAPKTLGSNQVFLISVPSTGNTLQGVLSEIQNLGLGLLGAWSVAPTGWPSDDPNRNAGIFAAVSTGGSAQQIAGSTTVYAVGTASGGTLPPGPYTLLASGAALRPSATYLLSRSTAGYGNLSAALQGIVSEIQGDGMTVLGSWIGLPPSGWPTNDPNVAAGVFVAVKNTTTSTATGLGNDMTVFAAGGATS